MTFNVDVKGTCVAATRLVAESSGSAAAVLMCSSYETLRYAPAVQSYVDLPNRPAACTHANTMHAYVQQFSIAARQPMLHHI